MLYGLSVVSGFSRGLVVGVFCLACGSLVLAPNVSAQAGALKQEGARVAALETNQPAPPATFARPAALPWSRLGPQRGYVSLRVADAVKHPLLNNRVAMVNGMIESALQPRDDGTAWSLAEFGFSLDKITFLEASAHISLDPIPEHERGADGATRKLGFGVNGSNNGFAIQASSEIDWPGILAAIDYEKFMDAENAEQVRKALVESSRPGREFFLSKPAAEDDSSCPEPTGRQKQMWTDVSGGVVTVFTHLNPANLPQPEKADADPTGTAVSRVFEETWVQIGSIAIGGDFVARTGVEDLRVALEPSSSGSANELAEQLKKLRQTLIDSLEAGEGEGMADSFRGLVCQQLRDARIVVVGTESGSYVLVTGQLSIAKMIEAQ